MAPSPVVDDLDEDARTLAAVLTRLPGDNHHATDVAAAAGMSPQALDRAARALKHAVLLRPASALDSYRLASGVGLHLLLRALRDDLDASDAAWWRYAEARLLRVRAAEGRLEPHRVRLPVHLLRTQPDVDAAAYVFGSDAQAWQWLALEWPNLLELLREASMQPGARSLTFELGYLLWAYYRRVQSGETVEVARLMLAAAEAISDPVVLTHAQTTASHAFRLAGCTKAALVLAARAAARRKRNSPQWYPGALRDIGMALRGPDVITADQPRHVAGDLDAAGVYFAAAASAALAIGDDRVLQLCLYSQADAAFLRGDDLDRAAELALQALEASLSLPNRRFTEAQARRLAAEIDLARGCPKHALQGTDRVDLDDLTDCAPLLAAEIYAVRAAAHHALGDHTASHQHAHHAFALNMHWGRPEAAAAIRPLIDTDTHGSSPAPEGGTG